MRLLIASDIHGAPDSVELLLRKAESFRPDACVLLGDLLYHGPRNPLPPGYTPADVPRLLEQLPAPIIAVRGNCDAEVDLMVLPFEVAENTWIQADGLRIFASHGHRLPMEPPFSGLPDGTVLLRGHSHVPQACTQTCPQTDTQAGTRGTVHQWNPGSTTLPKQGYPRSYGVYEDGEFRVMDFEDRVFLRHRPE